MSILQNTDFQESPVPKKVCGHFLQVGLTMAIFSQNSCDHCMRPSHDLACEHSRMKGRRLPGSFKNPCFLR